MTLARFPSLIRHALKPSHVGVKIGGRLLFDFRIFRIHARRHLAEPQLKSGLLEGCSHHFRTIIEPSAAP
jgi:hypothetical protein